jgi:hypothetical protein
MTELFTSVVCDVCSPPPGVTTKKVRAIDASLADWRGAWFASLGPCTTPVTPTSTREWQLADVVLAAYASPRQEVLVLKSRWTAAGVRLVSDVLADAVREFGVFTDKHYFGTKANYYVALFHPNDVTIVEPYGY